MEYPSVCELYLDGHDAGWILRRRANAKPIVFQYGDVSESSQAPFLFSPLVVTGEKAILHLELIMDATR
jgi:hypothetical protein